MNFQSWSCCCKTINVGYPVVSTDRGHPCHLERQRHINPYHILRLRKDATEEELAYSYQRLAILYHPVRANGDPQIFRAVSAAFETLQNKKTRAAMDRILKKSDSSVKRKSNRISSESAVASGKSDGNVRKRHSKTSTSDANQHRQDQEDQRYRFISPQQHHDSMCSSTVDEHEDRTTLQLPRTFRLMLKARRFEPFTDPYEVFASVFGSSLGSNREFTYTTDVFATERATRVYGSTTTDVSHNSWEFVVPFDDPAVVTDSDSEREEPWSMCCFGTGH